MVIKAGLSGIIVATVSEVAKRYPGWTALAAGCVPTILLYAGMTWLGPRIGLGSDSA